MNNCAGTFIALTSRLLHMVLLQN